MECGVVDITFVFTKFHSMVQNIAVQTENEDPEFAYLEEEK